MCRASAAVSCVVGASTSRPWPWQGTCLGAHSGWSRWERLRRCTVLFGSGAIPLASEKRLVEAAGLGVS